MGLPFAVLLVGLMSAVEAAVILINYKPQIITKPLEGRITGSTFALGTPECVFNRSDISAADAVWLVVAFSDAYSNFTAATLNVLNKPAYQDFLTNRYYLTLNVQTRSYPCDTNVGLIRVIRVGSNTTCGQNMPDCNGPLPSLGPYRVKFLVIDPSNSVKAETLWSDDITLKAARYWSDIDPSPGRRSGGMIVITTILSILLAILLALIIAVLVYGWSDLCLLPLLSRTGLYHMGPFESMTVSTYNTHHVQQTRSSAADLLKG